MVRHRRHPAHHSISVCEECGRHMSVHGRNPVKFIIVYGIDHDKWRLVCAPIRVNVDGNRDGRLDVWVQQYQAESEDAAPTGTDVRRAQSKLLVEALKTWLETKIVAVSAITQSPKRFATGSIAGMASCGSSPGWPHRDGHEQCECAIR